jgi:hypothetical protein
LLADKSAAVELAACRCHQHDDPLILQPGNDRGAAV